MKTKKTIENYLKRNSIKPNINAYLANDLRSNDWKALRFPAYSICKLAHLKNLTENIKELGDIEIKDNASKSKYYNQLTEFFGIF